MKTVLPIAIGSAAAAALALAVTPLLRRLAHRLGVTDRPDGVLKPHATATAYLGGAAFYLAWAGGLTVMRLAWPGLFDGAVWRMVAVVAAVSLLPLAVGLIDDKWSVPPAWRVAAELAAAVLLWWAGVRFVALPDVTWVQWAVGLPLQAALVLGACNAVNLLDGLDGLCGGVLAIALAGLAALAAGALRFGPADEEQARRLAALAVLAPPLAAALVGFLRYNYRPASIFMGDAGSLLLGFAVAAGGALLCGPGWRGLHLGLSGLVIVGLPVGDTALAFYRRLRIGRPLFEGDRSHFYDQLVDRGLSVPRAVNLCYAIGAGLAAVGWIGGVLLPMAWAFAFYAATAAGCGWALRHWGFTRPASGADADG